MDNFKAKKAAEQDARNVIGVCWVKNHLKVRPVNIPSDDMLEKRVANALLVNPWVDRFEIDIDAVAGWVYLSGNVTTLFEIKEAERVAGKGHQSVLRVHENEMETTMKQRVNKLQSNSHEKYTISGIAIEVKGYMTLTDVAQKYNVPVEIILNQLEIPKSALNVQKLGRLRKLYGFEMTDIERIIYEYRKSH